MEEKYTEVSIPEVQWLDIDADTVAYRMQLRAWFLMNDFNPLSDIEAALCRLEPQPVNGRGTMYFRDPESGQLFTGRFSDEKSLRGVRRYLFNPYQYRNETQGIAAR